MLVGADDGAVDRGQDPSQLAGGIGLLLQGVQDALTDARARPPIEAAGDGAPGTIALRQVPPRSPGAQDP